MVSGVCWDGTGLSTTKSPGCTWCWCKASTTTNSKLKRTQWHAGPFTMIEYKKTRDLIQEPMRPYAIALYIQAKLGQDNLLRIVGWIRWRCLPQTGFEIRTMVVWSRTPQLSVTEASHDTEYYKSEGKKQHVFLRLNTRAIKENPKREMPKCTCHVGTTNSGPFTPANTRRWAMLV